VAWDISLQEQAKDLHLKGAKQAARLSLDFVWEGKYELVKHALILWLVKYF